MDLEPIEPLVEGSGEVESPHREWDGADAAAGDRAGFGGDLVVDVRGGEDRPWRGGGDRAIEPLADIPLAGGVVWEWNRSHSRSPRGLGYRICVGRSHVPETRGDFEHLTHYSRGSRLEPRLVKG